MENWPFGIPHIWYVVYALVDPADDLPRYVGVTKDVAKRYRQHAGCVYQNNLPLVRWLEDLKYKRKIKPKMKILAYCNYENWVHWERMWIAFGLENEWPLLNMAKGGKDRGSITKGMTILECHAFLQQQIVESKRPAVNHKAMLKYYKNRLKKFLIQFPSLDKEGAKNGITT